MKKIYFVLAVLAVLASSCAKENICNEKNTAANGTLTARISESTKTAFNGKDGNVTKMVWSAGDELCVFDSELTNSKYTLKDGAGQTSGVFQSNNPLTTTGNVVAFYPYSYSVIKPNYIGLTIPCEQTPETIGDGIIPMIATGTLADGLTFKHLCAILRLQVYTSQSTGKTISQVNVTNGSTKKYIARRYYIMQGKSVEDMSGSQEVSTSIAYKCDKPLSADANAPTTIDILVASYTPASSSSASADYITLYSGFSVEVICTDGTSFTKTLSNKKVVNSGSIVTFPAFDCTFTSNLQISYDGGNNWNAFNGAVNIPSNCTDIAVKGSGMLSDAHISAILAAVAELEGGKAVNLDFSAVKYELTTLSNVFKSAKGVKNVLLPNNIAKIDNEAFKSSSIEAVTIPASCTDVGSRVFASCSKAFFRVADENTTFKAYDGCLYSYDGKRFVCANYKESAITIREGVQTIGSGAFYQDAQISKLVLPSTLLSIERYNVIMSNLQYVDASKVDPSVTPSFDGLSETSQGAYRWGKGLASEIQKKVLVPAGKVSDYANADGWKVLLLPADATIGWYPWVFESDNN